MSIIETLHYDIRHMIGDISKEWLAKKYPKKSNALTSSGAANNPDT
jgi:hypothetical protein